MSSERVDADIDIDVDIDVDMSCLYNNILGSFYKSKDAHVYGLGASSTGLDLGFLFSRAPRSDGFVKQASFSSYYVVCDVISFPGVLIWTVFYIACNFRIWQSAGRFQKLAK